MHILIDGVAALAGLRRIERLDGARRGLRAAGEYLHAQLVKAPPPRRGRAVFASDRQRRGFFARLRSGAIHVPYVRTGGGWTVDHDADALRTVVGTRKAGARYVWSDQQIAFHRATGWRTARQTAHEDGAHAAHIVGDSWHS